MNTRTGMVGALLAGSLWLAVLSPAAGPEPAQVEVAFDQDCEKLLLDEVATARSELLVAAYLITRDNIVDALVRAAQRGVKVRLKYDAGEESGDKMKAAIKKMDAKGVACEGIQLAAWTIMHHKFIVVDRKRVLTGSYNFTSSASRRNYENLVLIDSPRVAQAYAKEFESIRDSAAAK